LLVTFFFLNLIVKIKAVFLRYKVNQSKFKIMSVKKENPATSAREEAVSTNAVYENCRDGVYRALQSTIISLNNSEGRRKWASTVRTIRSRFEKYAKAYGYRDAQFLGVNDHLGDLKVCYAIPSINLRCETSWAANRGPWCATTSQPLS